MDTEKPSVRLDPGAPLSVTFNTITLASAVVKKVVLLAQSYRVYELSRHGVMSYFNYHLIHYICEYKTKRRLFKKNWCFFLLNVYIFFLFFSFIFEKILFRCFISSQNLNEIETILRPKIIVESQRRKVKVELEWNRI